MMIGKYRVGWDSSFAWQSTKEAAVALLGMVYQCYDVEDDGRVMMVGPLVFTWKL